MYLKFSGLQVRKLVDREITETVILQRNDLQVNDSLPIMIDNTVLSDYYCRIVDVRKVGVGDITLYDLNRMGFRNFREFHQYLKWFHGLEEEQLFYLIRFDLCSFKS